jgi:Zn-dependent protease
MVAFRRFVQKVTMRIGRFFQVDVVLHWTFVLAPLYVLFSRWGADHAGGAAQWWWNMGWMQMILFCIFLFVLLHEYGHALAARWFGIGTKEIVLTPIGGLAMLKSMPREPYKEMVIAIAGPLVNLVLAGIFLVLYLAGALRWSTILAQQLPTLWTLLIVNVMLFGFNLLPAFPMDGGRILRAMLAVYFNYEDATRYAVNIARIAAVIFMFVGLTRMQFSWVLIGLFVYVASSSELIRLRMLRAYEEQQRAETHRRGDASVVEGHVVRRAQDDARERDL